MLCSARLPTMTHEVIMQMALCMILSFGQSPAAVQQVGIIIHSLLERHGEQACRCLGHDRH